MAGTHDAPQSANEAILQNMLGENNELREPQSRIEQLLLELLEQGKSGGKLYAHYLTILGEYNEQGEPLFYPFPSVRTLIINDSSNEFNYNLLKSYLRDFNRLGAEGQNFDMGLPASGFLGYTSTRHQVIGLRMTQGGTMQFIIPSISGIGEQDSEIRSACRFIDRVFEI